MAEDLSDGNSVASEAMIQSDEEDQDYDLSAQLEDLDRLVEHLGRDTGRGSAASSSSGVGREAKVPCHDQDMQISCIAPTKGVSPRGAKMKEQCASLLKQDRDDLHDLLTGPQLVHYELQRFALPHGCCIENSPGSAAQYFFTIDVAEGPYTPATVTFWIKVFEEYPAPDSVSVRCTKRLFHPNIDPESGTVELAELGGGVTLSLARLLMAIRQIIVRPTSAPAVNPEAASLLEDDPDEFRRVVRHTFSGGEHGNLKFDRLLINCNQLVRPASRSSSGTSALLDTSLLSDTCKLDLMQLEVMRDKLKSQVSAMQQRNAVQMRDLS